MLKLGLEAVIVSVGIIFFSVYGDKKSATLLKMCAFGIPLSLFLLRLIIGLNKILDTFFCNL